MTIPSAACTEEYPQWVPVVPLCQAVHTLEPGTPPHAHGVAQGHAPSSLARGHERRGSLDLLARRNPTAGTRPPCRAALHLPRHPTLPPLSSIPCTFLLLIPALAAQSLSRAEDVLCSYLCAFLPLFCLKVLGSYTEV